jgi:hypothetical protein
MTPFPHPSEQLHMNGCDAARLADVLQVFAQVELGLLSRHLRVLAEFSVFAEQPRPAAAAANGT